MYFKYLNKLYSQCIICDAEILSTLESVKNHLRSHSKEQREKHKLRSWPRKYCTQRDDFHVQCNICYNNFSLCIHSSLSRHVIKTHSDKVKNTQETHDTVCSSERVSSLETDTSSMSLNIATKKHLWKYYVQLPDFEAQCKFCESKYIYIDAKNFKRHVARKHSKIWKYEEKKKLIKGPWMYFKYSNKLYSQCIICDGNVLSTSESVKNHLSLHSEEQWKNCIPCNWARKYLTKSGDFEVECNICQNDFSLSIHSSLDHHIKKTHLDKLKNMQERRGTVVSSECVSSLEMDATSILPKDCYVLLTRCPPYNLYI
nr:PREDICTED: uncharacterized protein LOC105673738 [Linepithema humile]